MKERFTILLTLGMLLIVSAGQAQIHYKNALGVRLGSKSGISYKQNINNKNAYELMLVSAPQTGGFGNGVGFAGFYKWHYGLIKEAPTFNLFLGAGGTVGFWEGHWDEKNPHFDDDDEYNKSHVWAGPAGMIGVEYTIPKTPVNFAFDITPTFYLLDDVGLTADGALTIRVLLDKL